MHSRTIAFGVCLLAVGAVAAEGLGVVASRSTNSLGMEMVRIAPGSFAMGSTNGDWTEQPVHEVKISRAFWISADEVSLTHYQQFRPTHRPAAPSGAATGLSWYDAMAFCDWLSRKEGKPYRLPTEAEWEYACRAHGSTSREGGAGLRRTLDDVPEWCLDWFGEYPAAKETDPVGPASGMARIVRGDKLDDSKHLLRGNQEEDYRRPTRRAGMAPAFGASQSASDDASAPGQHAIGFRVVQAEVPPTKPRQADEPFVQCGVKQSTRRAARVYGPDPAQPYFRKRFLLPTPPENSTRRTTDAAGLHPSFCGHNHSPAVEVMPNGDVLLVIFTSWTEYEPEMSLMATRLRFGADEWEMPSYFVDCPGACDNCPLLWTEGEQVRLFWANTCGNGAFPFQWITSDDSGATWNETQFPHFTTPIGPHSRQPINTAVRDRDGTIYLASDAVGASSVLWVSKDGMHSWQDSGGRTGGRHTTVTLLKDRRTLLGMGGKSSDLNGYMPKSVSDDGGSTWQISPTMFPAYGANQRPCVLRLKSGRLFFCGDFQRIDGKSPSTITNRGAFAALSDDDGKTWRIKKLPGAQPHENPRQHRGADTLGYSVARQAPNGMIHLITTMNRPCLHFELNEAWILADDPTPSNATGLMSNPAATIRDVRRYEERYANGRLKIVWHAGLADDGRYLLHGKETWHFPNGRKQYEATFALGRKVGMETIYRADGSKAWQWQHSVSGISTWTQWWTGGRKKSASTWRNFHADGPARRWAADGRLVSYENFREGRITQ